jgi:predicted Zn finger-like uncharacterized protein
MIVTCPQCQTRFRIPDDKVTAKGVKVRCTRCRHTFRVSRPAEQQEASEDPFAQFAPPDALSEEDKTPTRGLPVPATLGVEVEHAAPPPTDDFDVDVEAPDKRRESPAWDFPPPPPRPPEPSAVAPPVQEPVEDATPRVALARILTVRQLTVVPAAQETPAQEEDLGLEGPPDAPLELDTGSPHSAWQGSLEGGLELPPSSGDAEFDFGDLNLDSPGVPVSPAPPPAPVARHSPTPTPMPVGRTPQPAPPPPAAPFPRTPIPAPQQPDTAELDFDEMQSPIAPMAARPQAQAVPQDLAFGEMDVSAPEAHSETALDYGDGEPALAPPGKGTPVPQPDGRTPTGELFGKSATRLDEELFPLGPAGTDVNTAADRAAFFDMPERHAAEDAQQAAYAGPTSLLADVPDAIPDAPVHPAAGLPAVPPTTVGRVSRPPTGTSVLGLEERRELGAARRVSAAVVNIGVAALLVLVLAAVGNVYVNEGHLDWAVLSPRRWAALFVPPSGIVTLDVSNGLYETRGGRPLAYVRGRVENRGQRPGQVLVRAEIWDGSQLLGTSEGLAGVLPTPEEMVEASTGRDVAALRARLQQGAPAVAPGKGTDFVLLFDEPPAEAAGLRLKVTAAAADGR